MKTCRQCKAVKPCEAFSPNRRVCRQCRERANRRTPEQSRHRHLRRTYGLTPDAWEQMRADQRDACASCREPFRTTPHTDHCHTTGKVRGLLCLSCNLTLGQSKESPARLLGLVDYLARH